MKLQDRLRNATISQWYIREREAADRIDALEDRIKDLEDTERAYEELSQYLVGDKMIAPMAGVIALETRIVALEEVLHGFLNEFGDKATNANVKQARAVLNANAE